MPGGVVQAVKPGHQRPQRVENLATLRAIVSVALETVAGLGPQLTIEVVRHVSGRPVVIDTVAKLV